MFYWHGLQIRAIGADFFLSMALFYCILFPIKDFSLDRFFFKGAKINTVSAKWSLILLQAHLCIIYGISGFDKGLGISWYNGESIWKAVSSHNYNGLISLSDFHIPSFVFRNLITLSSGKV